jgi:hypothetical protein
LLASKLLQCFAVWQLLDFVLTVKYTHPSFKKQYLLYEVQKNIVMKRNVILECAKLWETFEAQLQS